MSRTPIRVGRLYWGGAVARWENPRNSQISISHRADLFITTIPQSSDPDAQRPKTPVRCIYQL